jgi:molybdate transport system substrate-binding protein
MANLRVGAGMLARRGAAEKRRRRDRAMEGAWNGGRRLARLGLGLALVVSAAGAAARADALRVGAAVSLREPLGAIARLYAQEHPGSQVVPAFGASSVLAAQVRAGAPLDLLVSADERIVDELAAAGLVAARATVAGNGLVVVVAPQVSVRVAGPSDLLDPALRRIAIPDRAVPVGHYAREWLERRGLLAAVSAREVRTEHARATLAVVDRGNADAAIVYASDARLARHARVAFAIPDGEQPRIAYVGAVVAGSPHASAARDFLAFLAGARAQALLRDAGFRPPPGPP